MVLLEEACANQSKSSCQDSKTSDSVNKGSGERPSQSTHSKDDLMDGGSKEPSPNKRERAREREPPDTTTKPERKALKTSGAASSAQEIDKEGGTHTEGKSREPDSSGNDEDQASKMHRIIPANLNLRTA